MINKFELLSTLQHRGKVEVGRFWLLLSVLGVPPDDPDTGLNMYASKHKIIFLSGVTI